MPSVAAVQTGSNYAPGLDLEKTFTMEFYYLPVKKVVSPLAYMSEWDLIDLCADVDASLGIDQGAPWFVIDDFGNAVGVDGFYHGSDSLQDYSFH